MTQRRNTQTAELLDRFPLNEIFAIWFRHGLYKASEILDCNTSVLHYVVRLHNWKRPLPPHLVKAYKKGRWNSLKTNYYPNNQETN